MRRFEEQPERGCDTLWCTAEGSVTADNGDFLCYECSMDRHDTAAQFAEKRKPIDPKLPRIKGKIVEELA